MVVRPRRLSSPSLRRQLHLTRSLLIFPPPVARGRRGKPHLCECRTPTTARCGPTLPRSGTCTLLFVLQTFLPRSRF